MLGLGEAELREKCHGPTKVAVMFHPNGPTFLELARQALSSTEKGYDLLASKFDHTPFRTPAEVLDVVAGELSKLGPFEDAIDLCCGTGAGLEMLDQVGAKRAVGFDRSQGMLEVAASNQKLRRANLGNQQQALMEVELCRGDISSLPFSNEFDLAVSFGAFGHILPKDEDHFIEQVAKALRPGGRFVFVTTYLPSRLSKNYWLARGFNGAMHCRNLLLRPSFIMFYLTFLLPKVEQQMKEYGFEIELLKPFEGRYSPLNLVIATLAR